MEIDTWEMTHELISSYIFLHAFYSWEIKTQKRWVEGLLLGCLAEWESLPSHINRWMSAKIFTFLRRQPSSYKFRSLEVEEFSSPGLAAFPTIGKWINFELGLCHLYPCRHVSVTLLLVLKLWPTEAHGSVSGSLYPRLQTWGGSLDHVPRENKTRPCLLPHHAPACKKFLRITAWNKAPSILRGGCPEARWSQDPVKTQHLREGTISCLSSVGTNLTIQTECK